MSNQYIDEEEFFGSKKTNLGGASQNNKYITEKDFLSDTSRAKQYIPEHEFLGASPPRTITDTAKDTLVSAGKGIIGLGEAGVGLADIATGGRAGKALEGAGVNTKQWQQSLSDLYSPAQQEANQRVEEATGFVDTAKAMIENPSTIYHSAVETIPSMVGGGVAGAGLKTVAGKVLPSVVSRVAPKTATMLAGAAGEGIVGAGSSAENIRQSTDDGLLTGTQTGLAALSGLGTAAFGAAGGRLAQRLGFADADTMFASAFGKKGIAEAADMGAQPRGVADIAKAIVGGGISEGVFEELPQSVQEQIFQNAALNRPLMEGVPKGAAQSMIVGAAMGSGVNVASEVTKPFRPEYDQSPTGPTVEERKAQIDGIRQANPSIEELNKLRGNPEIQEALRVSPDDVELLIKERDAIAEAEVVFALAPEATREGAKAAIRAETDQQLFAGQQQEGPEGLRFGLDAMRYDYRKDAKGFVGASQPSTISQDEAEARQFGRDATQQELPPFQEGAFYQDDLIDDWADTESSLQQQTDARGRRQSFLRMQEGQRTATETTDANVTEEVKAVLPAMRKMREEIRGGSASGSVQDRDGNTAPRSSSYPEWFKQSTVKAYNKKFGENISLSKGPVLAIIKKVEEGKPLTIPQQKIFNYLKDVATGKQVQDPEVITDDRLYQYSREGFKLDRPEDVAVGALMPGDEVIIEQNGVPDKLTHKGYDEKGNAILQDGVTIQTDPFEQIKVLAKKQRGEIAPEDNESMTSLVKQIRASGTQQDLDRISGEIEPFFKEYQKFAPYREMVTQAVEERSDALAKEVPAPPQESGTKSLETEPRQMANVAGVSVETLPDAFKEKRGLPEQTLRDSATVNDPQGAPAGGDVTPGPLKSITPEEARSIVRGKTEKPRGVDPEKQIIDQKEYKAGTVKLSDIEPNEYGDRELAAGPVVTGGAASANQQSSKNTEQAQPVAEEKGDTDGGESSKVAPAGERKIDDFGEKIGGARKDTAQKGIPRSATKKQEATGWRAQYKALENSMKPGEWFIVDTKDKSRWGGALPQRFTSQESAEKALPLVAVAKRHRVASDSEQEGKYAIYKDVSDRKRLKVVNRVFDSREEGMEYMAKHAEEILEIKTTFGEEILPVPEIAIRRGVERRTGPATPEMFKETFAPRGIQFGKWNNQEERQQVLDHAYDGLLDLADVLNVPPKALMLNGDLAIAFGARGQGLSGAKAHYETDYGIINLTKMSGAGSLAHEWFHALDHYLARQDSKAKSEKVANKRGDMVFPEQDTKYTMQSHGRSLRNPGVRPELQAAYDNLVDTMYKKAEQYVEDTKTAEKFIGAIKGHLREALDRVRADIAADNSRMAKKNGGWRRSDKGLLPASAEQLAEFDRLADSLVEGGNLALETRSNLSDEEKAKLESSPMNRRRNIMGRLMSNRQSNDTLDAIGKIYKDVRGSSGFNKEGDGALDRIAGNMRAYAQRLKMFEDAKNSVEKTKKSPTRFAIEAKKMDQARRGDYWSEPHEMAARAFASYVEDKVAETGGQSDFIVYHAHGGILLPMIDGFVARPYPEGDERVALAKAFDRFIKELKTKKTEKGTALYSQSTTPTSQSSLSDLSVKQRSIVTRLQRKGVLNVVSAEEAQEILSSYSENAMRSEGERTDWANDFPEAVIAAPQGTTEQHKDYDAAKKQGDIDAAYRVVNDILNKETVDKIRSLVKGDKLTIVVPVVSEERHGRNKLPRAYANALAALLDIETDINIIHINRVNRGGSGGFHRLANQPVFTGDVKEGAEYLVVDDTLTQGGTLASLKGHIETNGARVIGFSALTGKQYSAKIVPSDSLLNALREKYPTLEAFWKKEYGYGFERLTNSEANYLFTVKGHNADSIRAAIVKARQYQGASQDAGIDSEARSETPQVKFSSNGVPQGFTLPDGTVYVIPENIEKDGLWPVVRHEIGVHLSRLLQSDKGFRNLLATIEARANENSATGAAIRKAMARVPENTNPEYRTEEILAYLIESAPNVGIVRRFMAMLKNMLVKLGFSPKIFTEADLSALAEAAVRREAGGKGRVGDVMMSQQQGQFKPVDTSSANFKAWFGDSVVTEDGKAGGKPLVVYHGTGADFEAFDISQSVEGAIFFTSDPDVADYFAHSAEKSATSGPNTRPVFLSIKNPKILTSEDVLMDGEHDLGVMEEQLSQAKKEGHDGVIIKDFVDGWLSSDHYVVFSPTQIKSALSNTGDFSKTDPRIKYSQKSVLPTTPQFKAWHGDSKVNVPVYHGSPTFGQGDNFTFDPDRATGNTSSPGRGLGTFVTTNRNEALGYAGASGAVQELAARIENPLEINSWELPQFKDASEARAFRKRKQLQGYDGIHIKDEGHWVAFHPNQLKSITDNSGAFSRENNDIRYSVGKTAQVASGFLRDNFDLGYVEKSGLADAKFIGKILSSPEYTFTKSPAAWRAIQVQYNRLDNKVAIEDEILGNTVIDGRKIGFVQYMEEGKKKFNPDYTKSNNYLLETDKTGKGFTLKLHDPWRVVDPSGKTVGYAETQVAAYNLAEKVWKKSGGKEENILKSDFKVSEGEYWGVIDRQGKEVVTFENEVEAVRERDRREYADIKEKGFSQKAIDLVREYREMAGRAFDMMIADLRKIMADAKENGLDMPTVSVVDETKRWAVIDGGKIIATFETKTDAKQAAGGKHTVKEQKDSDIRKEMKLSEVIAQMADLRGTYFARQRDRGAIILRATKDGDKVMKKFDYHMMNDKYIDTATGVEYNRPVLNWMKGAINLGLSKIPGTLAKEAIELKRKGYTVEVSRDTSMPESVFQAAQLVSSMSSLIEEARARAKSKGDPKEVVEQGHKILMQALADIVKERGYMSSRLRRSDDYWIGFETDMLLSGTQYARGLAAGIAKKQAAKDFIAAITGTDIPWKKWKADYVEEGQEGTYEEYLDFVAKRRVNPTDQPQLYSYLMSWTDEMLRNEERVDRVMGTIKGLAIVKFLGFRVSSAAVNATNMLQAVPATIASQSGGTVRSAIASVSKAAVAYGKFRTTGKDISESDRKVLTEIVEKGWDVAQYNKEAAAVMQTKFGRGWDTFMEWSMKMFGAVEKANRSMTILAAYNEITKNTQLDHDKAMELAKHVSDRAHGVYGKATRPQWAQGAWNPAQLAFVFMKFTQNYINNMYEMGVKGDFRAVAYMLLSPAILAGAGASVVTPLVAALASSLGIGGDDPEEEFYQWAEDSFGSDALFRHGLAGLAGVNIKGSIQMNNPLPTTLWEAAGAPGSMVRDIMRGAESLYKGEYAKGAEALLPTAMGNLVRAGREYKEGLTTGSYAPRYYGTEPIKADGLDATLRVLSFNPAGISKKTEQQYREKAVAQRYAEERSDINAYAKKLFIYGKGDKAELASMMMRYNEKVRGSGRMGIPYITWTSIRSTVRRAQKPSKAEAGREK